MAEGANCTISSFTPTVWPDGIIGYTLNFLLNTEAGAVSDVLATTAAAVATMAYAVYHRAFRVYPPNLPKRLNRGCDVPLLKELSTLFQWGEEKRAGLFLMKVIRVEPGEGAWRCTARVCCLVLSCLLLGVLHIN